MYDYKKACEIVRLNDLVSRAKTEKTRAKHIAEINKLRAEIFANKPVR